MSEKEEPQRAADKPAVERNPLDRERDVADWRVVNKKAESDQMEYDKAMKKWEAEGKSRIPLKDWLDLQKPMTYDP